MPRIITLLDLLGTLGSAEATVTYSDLGQPVEIEAPEERLRMSGKEFDGGTCC